MSRFNHIDDQIKQHLFIVSPNNSGSTLLKNLLATSSATWNLKHEGQKTFGFAGPRCRDLHLGLAADTRTANGIRLPPLVWAAEPRWVEALREPEHYDWPRIQHAWYSQATSLATQSASIFVEKSPFSVLNVAALKQSFTQPLFLFMVRNPYAVVEGIARRDEIRGYLDDPQADLTELAARHIIECLRWQQRNISQTASETANQGVFFSYEALCEHPGEVERKIRHRVPALKDLNLRQRVAVKGLYDETPRNMNQQQISRLTTKQLDTINRVFEPETALLASFGYALLSHTGEFEA